MFRPSLASTEINRIADSANFNGIKLLDGSQEIKTKYNLSNMTDATRLLSGEDNSRFVLNGDIIGHAINFNGRAVDLIGNLCTWPYVRPGRVQSDG